MPVSRVHRALKLRVQRAAKNPRCLVLAKLELLLAVARQGSYRRSPLAGKEIASFNNSLDRRRGTELRHPP